MDIGTSDVETHRLLKMINKNLTELNKTLNDFLTQYHNYEGKKK